MNIFESANKRMPIPNFSPSKEAKLKNLWSSLLDAETTTVCSGYLENEDCAIKLLLRVIYQQFKEVLSKKISKQPIVPKREDSPKAKKRLEFDPEITLHPVQERNLFLEKRLEEIAKLLDSYNVLDAKALAKETLRTDQTLIPAMSPNKSPMITPKRERVKNEILCAATPENTTDSQEFFQTQHRTVPETCPANYDVGLTIAPQHNRESSSPSRPQKLQKSPVIKSKRKSTSMETPQSKTLRSPSMKRPTSADNSLTFCSPSLMERDALDYSNLQTTPKKQYNSDSILSPKPSTSKESPFKSPHLPKWETKNKQLKQTTLRDTVFNGKIQLKGNDVSGQNIKPIFLRKPDQNEGKRRKRKTPEDWPCSECRRLFYESKIDTRKLEVSMNFCPEHRNRFSYYLQTPPGFWDPDIPKGPRRALDVEAENDDFM